MRNSSYGKCLGLLAMKPHNDVCHLRSLTILANRGLTALDLKVEAFNSSIIMPNRHTDPHGTMYNGHLLESETYVGGHVEALEAGVFRSDILSDFKLVPSRCQQVWSSSPSVGTITNQDASIWSADSLDCLCSSSTSSIVL
jgi:hypothetical protein